MTTAIDILKTDYEPHGICFSLLGIDEIHDNTIYGHIVDNYTIFSGTDPDIDGDGKFDLLASYSHINAIDIFLFPNDPAFAGGTAVGIPGASFVLGGNNFGTNNITTHFMSHEMGHCLGLFHTFHGLCEGGSMNELVDGSNCLTAGDFVCDTPADNTVVNIDVDCIWNGVSNCGGGVGTTDANGTPYAPDHKVIMAGVPPVCMEYLTSGQASRMKDHIANTAILENTIVPDDLTLDGQTENSTVLYAVHNTITASNYSIVNPGDVTFIAGNDVILLDGFETNGGEFYAYTDQFCSFLSGANSAKWGGDNSATTESSIAVAADNNISSRDAGNLDLLSVYPVPFSSSATFQYTLLESGPVQILILDIYGKVVATVLHESHRQRGVHLQTIHGLQLSDGMYFCYFETRFNVETEKMIVLNSRD